MLVPAGVAACRKRPPLAVHSVRLGRRRLTGGRYASEDWSCGPRRIPSGSPELRVHRRTGTRGESGSPVLLTASFRSSIDTTQLPANPAHYLDKILSDTAEPYETDSGGGVSVWFTQPNGELLFKIEHHAARSVRVIFPRLWNDTIGWLPDTLGFYAPPPEPPESVDFFRFQTYNSGGFAEPKINFLAMKHGTIAPVRLWTTICTTQRHNFYANYAVGLGHVGNISGVVEVAAFNDAVDPNKPATLWKVYPVPVTADSANLWKQGESGRNPVRYPFGSAPMPFLLTLQKQ